MTLFAAAAELPRTRRLGVLDVGSNTVHLLLVDAHRGAPPTPVSSQRWTLRLAEVIGSGGVLGPVGTADVVRAVAAAAASARALDCEELLAFATSAIRDAADCDDVLAAVAAATDIDLQVLPGTVEARFTFLAVRRWVGWSAGNLLMLDIGGGSLEIAGGQNEAPDVAWSVPLGAARLAREFFAAGMPGEDDVRALRKRIRAEIARDAGNLLRGGAPDRAAATSKTFRSLARICGAPPSGEGPLVPRTLPLDELSKRIPELISMTDEKLISLPGVSPDRAHQIVPGALVAEACMDIFDLPELEICPWALREGVILERFDQLGFLAS
jgi:exopolyphosphatase/guanosine-5'-triphosphate,3'-diphosphate pyrophosphatase